MGKKRYKIIEGYRYNKLVAIKEVEKTNSQYSWWLFKCDCGNSKELKGTVVLNNVTKSCGCLVTKAKRTDFNKQCTKCLIFKPYDAFYNRSSKKPGGRESCKSCCNLYYLKNKERHKKFNRDAYNKNKTRLIIVEPDFKFCSFCKQEHANIDFYKQRGNIDGLSHYCKEAIKIDKKLRQYGLTKEEYFNLFSSQEYKCKICPRELKRDRMSHIDHCHKTNKIRGVLCHYCNTGLGHFFDNPELLIKAAEYLKKE